MADISKKKKVPKITLYEAVDFKGRSKTFTDRHENLIDAGFNDYTSSVIVESGVWILYQHCNYTGNICVLMEGDRTNLADSRNRDKGTKVADFNDRVSSLKPLDFDFTEEPRCTVYVHSFSGRSLEFTEDILDLRWYKMNDQVSSIRVHSGAWVGYDGVNFRGTQSLFLPGDHNMSSTEGGFRNDRLSSLRPLQIVPSFPIIVDDITFHLDRGKKFNKPMAVFSWTQKNDSKISQKLAVTKEKSITTEETYEFRWNHGTKISLNYRFETSVPFVAKSTFSLGIETHYDIGSTEGKKTAKTEKWKVHYPSEIPAKSVIELTSTLTQSKIDVPFTAKFHQGDKKWTEEGTFYGTQYHGLVTEFKQKCLHDDDY